MTSIARPIYGIFTAGVITLVALGGGCGSKASSGEQPLGDDDAGGTYDGSSSSSGSGSGNGGGSGGTSFMAGTGSTNNCPPGSPLKCYVSTCSNGGHTTLTGKVYDPAGKNPLYNVVVFVPNDPNTLPAIKAGTDTCNSCDDPIGDYLTVAQTDKTGTFTLKDVPTGQNVPLTVQIGKWRRTITVANVADCTTTTVPDTGAGQARLPRNQKEGNMPKMALLTGGLDDLGCFMSRMGIDASEYSAPNAGGHLDIYQGFNVLGVPGPGLSTGAAGDCTNNNCPLWSSRKSLEAYDIVILACEGDPYDPDAHVSGSGTAFDFSAGRSNITKASKQYMHDWLNEGGKLFATHFHYTWFQNGPADFQQIATWKGWSLGDMPCANCSLDTSFVKGKNFHDWLAAVGALDSSGGISLSGMADSVSTVNPMTTSRWIYDSNSMDTKYLSFETPIGGRNAAAGGDAGAGDASVGETPKSYCGKAVFSDLHTGGAPPPGGIPGACKLGDLSAQEKALEYLFFDLAACVTDDSQPPPPPPPPPK